MTIKVIKIYGSYAKATVAFTDGSGETDIAYLENEDGQWILLDEGTGVDPEHLGLPREAW